MKRHLTDILDTLKGYTAAPSTRVRPSLLRKIVAFNRLRLQHYVRVLYLKPQECLDTPEIPAELSDTLGEIRDLAQKADNRELEEGECAFMFHIPANQINVLRLIFLKSLKIAKIL